METYEIILTIYCTIVTILIAVGIYSIKNAFKELADGASYIIRAELDLFLHKYKDILNEEIQKLTAEKKRTIENEISINEEKINKLQKFVDLSKEFKNVYEFLGLNKK